MQPYLLRPFEEDGRKGLKPPKEKETFGLGMDDVPRCGLTRIKMSLTPPRPARPAETGATMIRSRIKILVLAVTPSHTLRFGQAWGHLPSKT